MEILRKQSKSGELYRIYKEDSIYDMFVIEKRKEKFGCCFPAYEPKQKVFTTIKQAENAFNEIIDND